MERIFSIKTFPYGSTYKITCILGLLFIYQFCLFRLLITQPLNYNVYDLLLTPFSLLSLFLTISFFYLILIYPLGNRTYHDQYYNFRIGKKSSIFLSQAIIAFKYSILLVFLMNAYAFIESILNISYENVWSPYFTYISLGNVNQIYSLDNINNIMHSFSPLQYVILTDLLTILYLFFLGLLFIFFNLLVKRRALSLIIVYIMNLTCYIYDQEYPLYELTFKYNIYLINVHDKNILPSILNKFIYWVVASLVIYLLGATINKKSDYHFSG